jgi:hypothetical protein
LDAALPGQGQSRVRVVDGIALIDYVQHDAFIWAYAKRWEDTGWIAYRHDKLIVDAVREFGLSSAIAAAFVAPTDTSTGEQDKSPPTIAVYEVWSKSRKEVYFLTSSHPECCLKALSDPLQLQGFYPSGKPLRLLSTPCSTMPKSLYGLYKRQAEELNSVTERIRRITKAIQVRGLYDGNISELSQVFDDNTSENALIPAINPSTLMRDGGLDKHIWLIPVEKYVQVLSQLYAVREQIKATIYETLGIGDILRGVSAASETASAQEIKDKWGTLRIKKSREKVSAFVRTQIRLLIEVSAKHVDEQVWGQVTGLPFVSSLEGVVAAQGPQRPEGSPPVIDWGAVLGTLRDDLTRSYQIDIEANSTVDGDATSDKAELTEFMNALGQALAGLAPLGASSPEGFAISKAVMTELFKRFRMGNDLLGLIDNLKPQQAAENPKAQEMMKEAEDKLAQAEQAGANVKGEMDSLEQQRKTAQEQISQEVEALKTLKNEIEKAKMGLNERENQLSLREVQLTLAVKEAQLELRTTSAEVNLQAKENALTSKIVQKQNKTVATQASGNAPDLQKFAAAMSEQAAAVTALASTLGKPSKITKTGPNTYTRE